MRRSRGSSTGLTVFFQDVGVRRRIEERAADLERLESIATLAGGVAHDFNNLLTVIQGNLQVLDSMNSIQRAKYAEPMLAAAARAAQRGAELTGKLLAFSRRQMLQPTRPTPMQPR